MSKQEANRRLHAGRRRRAMHKDMRAAFGDLAMLDNAALVVWTRGQMNGVRAMIRRLRMA